MEADGEVDGEGEMEAEVAITVAAEMEVEVEVANDLCVLKGGGAMEPSTVLLSCASQGWC